MNKPITTSQAGFTLLEVAVAGSVAFLVIMGLFSAIRLAGDQGKHISNKMDERNLLSDLKYVLANPVLCKGSVDLNKEFKKKEEIKVTLAPGKLIGKGSVLPEYGMRVDSLHVIDTVQYLELRSYETVAGCVGKSTERFEYQNGKLERVEPKPGEKTCFGPLVASSKSYYVDVEVQLSALRTGSIQLRPERLSRMTVIKKFDKTDGPSNQCQAINVVRVDSNVVTPEEFQLRGGTLPPSVASRVSGGFSPARVLETFRKITASHSSSTEYNPYSESGRRGPPPPSFAPHEHFSHGPASEMEPIEKAAEEAAKGGTSAREDYARRMASLTPAVGGNTGGAAGATGPAVASSPGPSRPNIDGACALNMSAEEAADKGLPVVQHGKTLKMPLGDCMAKKYLCWEGKLSDLGGPPEKVACGSDPNGLDGAELARQAAAPEKKVVMDDCAVNRSLADAKRLHLPTYKTGERVSMPAGECLEKSYVCFDGSLRDEGLPATTVKGCSTKEIAAVK